MLGYWDNPEDTKAIIDETRWLHSGDIAVMDENGYVSIVGRIKDLIIRGGENISPKEIEDFLIVHEGVSDVQVIGVYSEKYGEEVMAWIFSVPNVKLCSRWFLFYVSLYTWKRNGPYQYLSDSQQPSEAAHRPRYTNTTEQSSGQSLNYLYISTYNRHSNCFRKQDL